MIEIQGYRKVRHPTVHWFVFRSGFQEYTFQCDYSPLPASPFTKSVGMAPYVEALYDDFEFLRFVVDSLLSAGVEFSDTRGFLVGWLQ